VFSLNPKDPKNVLSLINMCTLKLTTEEAQFRKVWDQHVGEDTSMYNYSAAMAKMIENELSAKPDEQLDFEKDPQHIVGELISALQSFDNVANR
jgi:hypothetical protein